MSPWHQTAMVRAPEVPIYLMGWDQLHGLGSGPQAVATASNVAGKLTTSILTSGASGGGATGIAAFAGPIGIGIAVVGSIIGGLWAAHNARVKGAKAENSLVNDAVTTFDASLRALFDAANSSDPQKYITAEEAIGYLPQLAQQYSAAVSRAQGMPGVASRPCGTPDPNTPCAINNTKCDKGCTAGCCVSCTVINPTLINAQRVLAAGGGSVNVCTVFGSKFGGRDRAGYTLTYKPNPPSVASVDALTQAITGSSGAAGGGSSWLLPVLGIGLALMAFH